MTLCGIGTVRGQYSVTGNTPGGGNTVVGFGSLGNLGPGYPLSSGGGDNITFEPMSLAIGTGTDTALIQTANNLLTNYGFIGSGTTPNQYGLNAITFYGNVTAETVLNNGVITGGVGVTGNFNYYGGIGGNAININTNGNVNGFNLNNAGQLVGGAGGMATLDYGGSGGSGFSLSSSTAANIMVVNSGLIVGGVGGNGPYGYGVGGPAIYVSSNYLSSFILNNTGSIIGGAGSTNGVNNLGYVSTGGDAMDVYGNYGISGLVINNGGVIAGGASGSATSAYNYGYYGGGYGIYIDSQNGGVNGFTLMNSGLIFGANGAPNGNYYDIGSSGGNGLYLYADKNSGNFNIANSGVIQGGNGSDTTNVDYTLSDPSYTYGFGGYGIYIGVSGNLSNVLINNTGSVIGGNGGNQVELTSGNTLYGASGGVGISLNPSATLGNVQINNWGSILGGNGGSVAGNSSNSDGYQGGDGGDGIYVSASTISGLVIYNASTGVIVGGNGGNATGEYSGLGGNGIEIEVTSIQGALIANAGQITGGNSGAVGTAGFIAQAGGAGVFVDIQSSAAGLVIYNAPTGVITGGNGGYNPNPHGYGGKGGAGISVAGAAATIANFGVVQGGNGGFGSRGTYDKGAGYGIEVTGDGSTIDNWGMVSAAGYPASVNATTKGFPNVAISVAGSNNTINLIGHSSVNGTIQAGKGSNNVLNLDFTGVGPQALANLKSQLAAQGWPATNDFAGSFTFRGQTIYIDPLILNLNATSYEGQALTPNQFAIGVSLDSATVNPAPGSSLANLFNAIDLSGNVPLSLEALSPQKYELYGDIAIQNSTALVQEIDQRLTNLREGSENIDTMGVGGGVNNTTLGLTKDDSKDGKEVVPEPAKEKHWGFFASGNGLFLRANPGDADLQQGSANTAGTVAGVDGKIGEHAVIGALFAYDNTNAMLGTDGSQASIQSYTPGIYGAFNMDGFYANGLAAYTRNNYSSSRDIPIPGFLSTAFGETNSNQYTLNMDGGYDWHLNDRLTAGPLAGLQYVHLDVNGFNESGAGAADLAVGSQSIDSLQSRLGAHVNYHLKTQSTVTSAIDLHAAWQHEYLDDSHGIGASFIGDGLTPFSVQTAAPRRDAGVVGVSVNFTFKDRVTLFADYDLLMWSASYFEQNVNAGCRISF